MHFLVGLEIPSGICSNSESGLENVTETSQRGTKRQLVTRTFIMRKLTIISMLRRVANQNLRPECQNMHILYFLNFIHLNVNGTCLLQVAEQHVKNDNRTRRAFLTVLKELNIELAPRTRTDLYSRFLRKIYNIRCNEFIRAQKCLEEHHCQQTQDRQVMLREKLKVQLQK